MVTVKKPKWSFPVFQIQVAKVIKLLVKTMQGTYLVAVSDQDFQDFRIFRIGYAIIMSSLRDFLGFRLCLSVLVFRKKYFGQALSQHHIKNAFLK